MHPFLTRLGVRPQVQHFFSEYYTTDNTGNLVFAYGAQTEHFGLGFHRVPLSNELWKAGEINFSTVRQVIVCSSAMEAIAYFGFNFSSFNRAGNPLFLATGARPQSAQINWITQNLSGKAFTLIFGNDLLGRICDLKVAAGIAKIPAAITFNPDDNIKVTFRNAEYVIPADTFSLNAFEKASGYRFGIRTSKPKEYDSFLDQLKSNSKI